MIIIKSFDDKNFDGVLFRILHWNKASLNKHFNKLPKYLYFYQQMFSVTGLLLSFLYHCLPGYSFMCNSINLFAPNAPSLYPQ